jgi:soluble lytic murein transglycosylase-like protein
MMTSIKTAALVACALAHPALCHAQSIYLQSFGASPQRLAAFTLLQPDHPDGHEKRNLPLSENFRAMGQVEPRLRTSAPRTPAAPSPFFAQNTTILAQASAIYMNPLPFGDCLFARYRPNPKLPFEAERRRAVWFPVMAQAACDAGVPVNLFDALITQESRYMAGALSAKGAAGMAQLMPASAKFLGVKNVWDPADNMRGGARYLRRLLDEFKQYDLALAAYNAGAGARSPPNSTYP